MKKAKKSLSIILCLLLIFALIGCNQTTDTPPNATDSPTTDGPTDSTNKPTDSPPDTSYTYTGEGPVVEEPVTLSMLSVNSNYTGVDHTHSRVIEKLQELANINLDLELLDNATYVDAMAPRLAAAVDLADIVRLPDADINMKYINSGIFIEITDLYEQYGHNLKPFWGKEYPQIKAQLTTPDGKLYYVSSVSMTNTLVPNLMINELWLKNLGLSWPQTTDEFYDTLKAFKEQDGNGNGMDDDIPFSVPGISYIKFLGSSWGLNLGKGYAVNQNGEVECSYTSPNYKEYLTYIKKLYDEELLDREFNSLNHDAVISSIANDQVGSTFQYAWHSSMRYAPLYEQYDGSSPIFSNIPPLQGPNGDKFYWEIEGVGSKFGITKYCENPDVAFMFLDYCFSDTIRDLMYWGIEDIDYVVKDGVKHETEFSVNERLEKPSFSGKAAVGFVLVQDVETIYNADVMPQWHRDQDQALVQHFKTPLVTVFSLQEEIDTLSMYSTDAMTFFDENMMAFILGTRSLDEFDEYVAEAQAYSIDKLTAVYEEQYQRFSSALEN